MFKEYMDRLPFANLRLSLYIDMFQVDKIVKYLLMLLTHLESLHLNFFKDWTRGSFTYDVQSRGRRIWKCSASVFFFLKNCANMLGLK